MSVRTSSGRWQRALPAAGALVAAATVAVGLALTADGRVTLGTPLPPFLFSWSPLARWPALVAGGVALGAAAVAPRLVDAVRGRAAFAAAVYGVALAVGLAVNAARRGTVGWSNVFDLSGHGSFEASREYLPALPQLAHGVGHYVRDFAQLLPYLPTHTKGNPPGPVVVMYLLKIDTPGRLAAACIGAGALCAPFTYGLGRALGDERRGRVAAILAAFSPALVLFGVTSMDFVFAALGTATAWLLVAPGGRARVGGCALAAIGSFASWLLLAIPAWAVLVCVAREGPRAALRLAGVSGAAILAGNGLLAVTLGYDPVATLRELGRLYGAGAAAHRPYAFWLLGSPVAWLIMLGMPVAWIALRGVARRDPAALALAAVIAVSAVAGATKAETERIWLPFVPLACVAAAAVPIPRLRLVAVALALQAVAVELLFATKW